MNKGNPMDTQTEQVPMRLAQHLALNTVTRRCELSDPTRSEESNLAEAWREDRGRCRDEAVAIRWEDGFADSVCERHAQNARERGAVVVYPKRHDGEQT